MLTSPFASPAPCDPTNVAAALECVSGVATVTWGAGAGARHYTVVAEANGHVDSCHTSGTSCQLSGLQCGEDYTVTVLAGDGTCNSTFHARTNVTTGEDGRVQKQRWDFRWKWRFY